jgi:hypothetical protein
MKKIFLLGTLALSIVFTNKLSAQTVYDYKVKTKDNAADRTKMLDILRAKLYEEYRQEFVFVVDKLNVSGGYAWFQGVAKREDGMPVQVDENLDCCHVEALMKVSKGKWYIVEMGAFSTDVWWDGLWERTGAPKKIFFQ